MILICFLNENTIENIDIRSKGKTLYHDSNPTLENSKEVHKSLT